MAPLDGHLCSQSPTLYLLNLGKLKVSNQHNTHLYTWRQGIYYLGLNNTWPVPSQTEHTTFLEFRWELKVYVTFFDELCLIMTGFDRGQPAFQLIIEY